jgi:hypothetical protein
VKRAASKSWRRLVRAEAWCERAWTERAQDGRIRYAMAGVGLGLIVGTFLSVINDIALIALVGFPVGAFLFAIALMPQSWADQAWAWRRRRR